MLNKLFHLSKTWNRALTDDSCAGHMMVNLGYQLPCTWKSLNLPSRAHLKRFLLFIWGRSTYPKSGPRSPVAVQTRGPRETLLFFAFLLWYLTGRFTCSVVTASAAASLLVLTQFLWAPHLDWRPAGICLKIYEHTAHDLRDYTKYRVLRGINAGQNLIKN